MPPQTVPADWEIAFARHVPQPFCQLCKEPACDTCRASGMTQMCDTCGTFVCKNCIGSGYYGDPICNECFEFEHAARMEGFVEGSSDLEGSED